MESKQERGREREHAGGERGEGYKRMKRKKKNRSQMDRKAQNANMGYDYFLYS